MMAASVPTAVLAGKLGRRAVILGGVVSCNDCVLFQAKARCHFSGLHGKEETIGPINGLGSASKPATIMEIDQRFPTVQSSTKTASSLVDEMRCMSTDLKTVKWLLIATLMGTIALVINAFLT